MSLRIAFLCALISTEFASSVFGANGVFYRQNDKVVWRADNGSEVKVLAEGYEHYPNSLAQDSRTGGKIYWGVNNTIFRANIDGSGVMPLIQNAGYVQGLVIDEDHEMIYWIDYSQCEQVFQSHINLRRASLNGGGYVTIRDDPGCAQGVALDSAGGKVYWTQHDSNAAGIHRCNLDGTQHELVIPFVAADHGPGWFSLDLASGKMIWGSQFSDGSYAIQRSNLDGSQIEDLVTGLDIYTLGGFSIDPQEGKLYWTEHTPSKIRRANLDGSQVEDMVTFGDAILGGVSVDIRAQYCSRTAIYGDITHLAGSIEFGDIAAIVHAFRGVPSIDPALCDLFPCDLVGNRCMGDGVIDFQDISQVVRAFRGEFTCPQ